MPPAPIKSFTLSGRPGFVGWREPISEVLPPGGTLVLLQKSIRYIRLQTAKKSMIHFSNLRKCRGRDSSRNGQGYCWGCRSSWRVGTNKLEAGNCTKRDEEEASIKHEDRNVEESRIGNQTLDQWTVFWCQLVWRWRGMTPEFHLAHCIIRPIVLEYRTNLRSRWKCTVQYKKLRKIQLKPNPNLNSSILISQSFIMLQVLFGQAWNDLLWCT